MGISWGLETRVLELFVIECLSCSLLPPQKDQKNFFQKSESQEIPDTKLKKKSQEKIQEKKSRKKDDTKTKHPQIITYKKAKKTWCWKFYPAHFLNKSFKPS